MDQGIAHETFKPYWGANLTRIGINPARHRVTSYRPETITVAVLTYVPHLEGYFKHRLDVVKLSLSSLIANTRQAYDLLVFDNGSCEQLKEYLRELQANDQIRYLILASENIGKLGALKVIAGAAPGKLVAYSDDDTFFYPGWLAAHLSIFHQFPKVGMVSGSPERTLFDHGISSNLEIAQEDNQISSSFGHTIPELWEEEWATALGYDPAEFLEKVKTLQDITLEKSGFKVYATACHNQFLSPKSVMQDVLQGEWSGRLMGGLNEFDDAIDAAGFLRLTTLDRTTRLIGNIIGEDIAKEARQFKIQIDPSAVSASSRSFSSRLLRIRPIRWFIQGLYNRLFWILTSQQGDWIETDQ
jgi:glycosyltransferase involved in cell wall biosynthesis